MSESERVPQLLVGVARERVEIESNRARVDDRVLWYHGDVVAEIVQADAIDAHVVDGNVAVGRVDETK